ncbi:MAG TPA: GNAT family N-acetyltransferase [Pyrinomonadaceae bacterium]|nr:GNAT family N-acetyltransferase [Pyrinomonadaceae bacterium]
MPRIKPLQKLVSKARDLREAHDERHRPTGFGFALADSVDYLDKARWDAVTGSNSIFFSRRYLRVLEDAGPENLQQRYALVFRGREPVAAVAAHLVTISLARVGKARKHPRAVERPLEHLDERMLVCGNLLSWGMHGVCFAPNEDPAALWPAVAEALYRIRRADKLSGDTDLVMVKDFSAEDASGVSVLRRFSYRELETDPNMVLEISPAWRSYDDYLKSLTSKYRNTCKQIDKKIEAGGCTVEPLTAAQVGQQAESLHQLYVQTHSNAKFRPVTLRPDFLPTLADYLGEDFRCQVVKKDGKLLGFVTTLRDGETAVGYNIGFDRQAALELPIYLRLLNAVVADAIALGGRRLSLGRTALEPKARLGAKPQPMSVMVRHRIPMLNVLVRALLHTISHDEAPERNPFK